MGRFYDDAPDHEGYMERELVGAPDESKYLGHLDEATGSWWCSSWTNGLPAPTGRWRPACSCDWKGTIVDADDIVAIDPDHDPGTDMLDETVEDLLLGPWQVHVAGGRSLEELRTAAVDLGAAQRRLDEAVTAARSAGHSWEKVAVAVGLTRQAAHARWASRV